MKLVIRSVFRLHFSQSRGHIPSSGEDKLDSLSSDVIQNALKWKTNSNEQSKILKHSGQLFYVLKCDELEAGSQVSSGVEGALCLLYLA